MQLRKKLALVAVSTAALANGAFAAVPAEVTTAITTMKDDSTAGATAAGVAVISILAVVAMFRYIRKSM